MIHTFEDLDALAHTVWGEARGESEAGQIAVAHVVLNRAKAAQWPDSVAAVCVQPKQFSCWPVPAQDLSDPAFAGIVSLCCGCLSGTITDPTNGANHYLRPEHSTDLSWYDPGKVVAIIGHHEFLKL